MRTTARRSMMPRTCISATQPTKSTSRTSSSARRILLASSFALLTTAAFADEPALPAGAQLRGTVETDALREMPELKGARINRARDESIAGVRTLDQTWDADVGYRDAVRFYDRAFADALVI